MLGAMSVAPAHAAGQASPSVAPPPGSPRFGLFDSLRAIAAICVLMTHVAYTSGANYNSAFGSLLAQLTVGVPIFFIISGFLLYRPFFAARVEGREHRSLRSFARSRLLRIVPAYWLALTVLAIGPGLKGVFTEDWWIYYGFAQGYSADTVVKGLPQAWSLGVELAFYVCLPFLAVGLARLSRGGRDAVRTDLLALGALVLCCQAFRVYAHLDGSPFLFQTLPATFDWFALGMALAVLSVAVAARERPPGAVRFLAARPGLSWIGAVVTFVLVATLLDLPRGLETEYTFAQRSLQHFGFGLAAVLLCLPAVFGQEAGGLTRRLLANRGLAWLGTVSYGVFLYNLHVADWLQGHGLTELVPPGVRYGWLMLGTLLVAAACAAVSYYGLERPLLTLKHRRRGGGGSRMGAEDALARASIR